MLILTNKVAIPQPANWPNGVPWNAAQIPVTEVFLDAAQFGFPRSPGFTLQFDESLLTNIPNGAVLYNHWSDNDIYGLGRWYLIPQAGPPPFVLWERFGWVKEPASYTPDPAQDVMVPLPQSVERGNFEQNLQAVLTFLDNQATQTATTVGQLNTDKQNQARSQAFIVKLLARVLFPDRADI